METTVQNMTKWVIYFKIEVKNTDTSCALTADISSIMHSTSTALRHTH